METQEISVKFAATGAEEFVEKIERLTNCVIALNEALEDMNAKIHRLRVSTGDTVTVDFGNSSNTGKVLRNE